jgi:hypothetical protein
VVSGGQRLEPADVGREQALRAADGDRGGSATPTIPSPPWPSGSATARSIPSPAPSPACTASRPAATAASPASGAGRRRNPLPIGVRRTGAPAVTPVPSAVPATRRLFSSRSIFERIA